MRFKEFVIFIIIFTIIYVLFFVILDYFTNKKAVEHKEEEKENNFSIELFNNFAAFYGITPTATLDVIRSLFNELENNLAITLSETASKYNISIDELIVVILFLEYKDLIKKRIISQNLDRTTPLTEKEESLILKYSLLFFNKFDYKTILEKAGFGAEQEIQYLMEKKLLPGVKIENNNFIYVGD